MIELPAEPPATDARKPEEPSQTPAPKLPRDLWLEITKAVASIRRKHASLFQADPTSKARAVRLFRSLLPPKLRRRGRPGRPDVTNAIRLLKLFKRRYPNEKPAEHWAKMYPVVIPGYGEMNSVEQRDARERLRERVRWRQRKQRHIRDMAAELSHH